MRLPAESTEAINIGCSEVSESGYKRFRRRGKKAAETRAQAENAVAPPEPGPAPAAIAKPIPIPARVEVPDLEPLVLSPARTPEQAVSVPLPRAAERWNDLRQITPSLKQIMHGGTPLVSFNRDDPASRAFDQLRTRLLQTLRAKGWSRIAIAAPTYGCGSTFVAVNLGLSLARIPGSRIVLMDLNLRSPGVARALDVSASSDPRGYLNGEIATSDYLVRVKDTLALGLANAPDQDAAELLHDQRTEQVLNAMKCELSPDVILYDLPPILEHDDLAAFLPQVDGVLLVSGGTMSTAAHIEACERILEGHAQVLGVILNQARS